jgi:hypothetical protein
MQFRTSTAAALVLAAGLTVGGCASTGSHGPSGGAATAPAANTDSNTQAAGATSTATSSQAAGTSGSCQAANLSFALGAKSGGAGQASQTTQAVDLTNKGSSACTMDGFPGVDLVGAANGQQNFSWSLQRLSASYAQVTLQPGGTAHFNLVYQPSASGDAGDITVDKLVLTPPNSFTQADVTWNQSVLLQDGATHPATYITPVVSGA